MKTITYFILLLILTTTACTTKPASQVTDEETILDAYWMLVSLEGQQVPKPNDSRMAYIRLQENENDVFGFTGCNKFNGKYSLSGNTLKMSELASTRMSCPSMDTENKLMEVLRKTTAYEKAGKLLTLYAGNKAVATFRTGNPNELGVDLRDR